MTTMVINVPQTPGMDSMTTIMVMLLMLMSKMTPE